jgi:hypothetical protein
MSTSRLFSTVSITALAAALLSSTAGFAAAPNALAAPLAGPSAERHVTPVQMHGPQMHRRGAAFDRTDHVEGRIAFLKAELKITDDQAPQWEAVAKAMRDQSAARTALRNEIRSERDKGEGQRDRAQRRQTLTAPQILDRREKAMTVRAKAVAANAEGQRQFAAAFRGLYDRLNDDQKKAADQLLAGRHHRA